MRGAVLMAEVQRAQDLLAEALNLSLTLVDLEGQEVTIPSRLPTTCSRGSAACEECGRHAAEAALAGQGEDTGLVRCPRNLLLLAYPTNFRLGDRCAVLVAGRTADEAALRRLRPLLEVLYSLPLNLEPSADPSPDGVPAEVLRVLASRGLTRQEIQVLRLISQGLTNKDIASRLFISENTVKTHVAHLLRKVGVPNRTGLAIFALDQGLGARENLDS